MLVALVVSLSDKSKFMEENIMSKKNINFKSMSEKAANQINSFKFTMIAMAKENVAYHATMNQLEKKLEAIKESRKNDLEQGMNENEVVAKYPTLEVDKAINREKLRHEKALAPLKEDLQDTYAFVPDDMYASYVRKIEDGKRGDFLNAIAEFLNLLGIENCTDAQIRAMAERMSDCLGAKVSNATAIVKNEELHSVLKKRAFYKLFMSVFRDLYM